MAKVEFVVMGATGYTGRLCCEYLIDLIARKYKEVKFAIAGRNKDELNRLSVQLRDTLEQLRRTSQSGRWGGFVQPSVIICDTTDEKSIAAMVQRGKCVINCAGPYTLHGEPVVRACIEHSVQYCDINGEPWWMKEMIEKYHQRAKEKKVAIVFACGFDSIPSDVGSFVLAQHIKETTGEDV